MNEGDTIRVPCYSDDIHQRPRTKPVTIIKMTVYPGYRQAIVEDASGHRSIVVWPGLGVNPCNV